MAKPLTKRQRREARASFLIELEERANVSDACKLAKISRATAYSWRDADDDFAAAWAEAEKAAADNLERAAWMRAVDGVEEPVGWHCGVSGGVVRKYSDTLLCRLLEAHRPERYRRATDVNLGGQNGPEAAPLKVDLTAIGDADREALQRIAHRLVMGDAGDPLGPDAFDDPQLTDPVPVKQLAASTSTSEPQLTASTSTSDPES